MMEKNIKLVVVGDAFIGKTSLLLAYSEKRFVGSYETTIFDNWAVTVTVDQNRYTLNLFDTAGQEEYAHLRCLGYPHTDVFLLCFSLVDRTSLENCQCLWMPEIRKYVGDDIPVLLVGTKQDLHETAAPQEKVDIKEAEQIAKEMGCITFLTCSALTHRGLKRVFDEAILAARGDLKPCKEKEKQNPCCKIL
uniref:Uncharacterized protein n=1 Tax=Panagrolaimus sp. JU765 TaxID=591449 RepID=A0AC34QYM8_9BILA